MSVGPLSDLYSLGCTLYYSVTGKVPFPGGDTKSKCRRHCEETPWHPRNLAPDLAEDFVDTIADMMEKEPARRIQTAAEVAQRLEPWITSGLSVVHDPQTTSESRQAWMPPPPPHEPSQLRESSRGPQDESGSGVISRGGDPSTSIPLPPDWDTPITLGHRRPSHTMPIAIALAIAVPLSLLVGAIIGFLIRGEV
jgi:serine/threonine protein kinase